MAKANLVEGESGETERLFSQVSVFLGNKHGLNTGKHGGAGQRQKTEFTLRRVFGSNTVKLSSAPTLLVWFNG